MRRNIIAIGGGDFGRGETASMDRELVRLTGKESPNLLFLPTATDDSTYYAQSTERVYGELGCQVDTLWLYGEDANLENPQRKIGWADAIYVGGGNTKSMLEKWGQWGVDGLLEAFVASGRPVGGISAGAICWFRVGNSDWPLFENHPTLKLARLDALGFVDLVYCPHASREAHRLDDFREMMRGERGVGVAMDDGSALQIRGDDYRVIASIPDAVGHRIEWVDGVLRESVMPPHDDFRPLSELGA